MAETRFAAIDGGYRITFIDCETEFLVERLRWERDELFGQLSVSCGLAGAKTLENGTLSIGTFNFSSPYVRHQRAKDLATRARMKVDSFDVMLEEVCQRVIADERRGTPAILLREVPYTTANDDEHDIDGFRFPTRHPTIPFGDGGGLKSLIALRVLGVLAQRGLRTALFDWELDKHAHRVRLGRIFGAEMPDVRYAYCERPLVYEIDRLRKIVRDERLDFAVLDSVGFGCFGPPEAAEQALAYQRAARQLGIGTLQVAHIRQGDDNDLKPFGSAFWHNGARSTWFVKRGSTSPDGQCHSIGLFNRKINIGALHPPVGYTVTFEGSKGRIWFARIDVATISELADELPLWQRMKRALTHGPLTLVKLSEELNAKQEALKKTVQRKTELFTRVSGSDGVTRIALVAREH